MARGGRPAVLTRERIVAAAIDIVDTEGLDALTMRRLGTRLGVAAMSLYRHLPNRDAVLAEVVNTLVGEAVADIEPGTDWPRALTSFATSYRRMLLNHPHAAVLLATHPVDVEIGMTLLRGVLHRFAEAGIDESDALTAVQSVAVYVLGHALAQVGRPPGAAIAEAVPDEAALAYYEQWFQVGLGAMVSGLRQRLRPAR